MSTQEVSSSVKWSAIRSRAVPSNLMPQDSASSIKSMNAKDMFAGREDKSVKFEKRSKTGKTKSVLPSKLHGAAGFAGSTGSSRV